MKWILMNIFNKQIVQEGFRLISNIYSRFFLLSVLCCPIPFQWDGLGMSLEGLEIQKLLSSSSGTNGKLLRLGKIRGEPLMFLSRSPLATQTSMLGVIPKTFFWDELQQLHELWLEIWQGGSLQDRERLFWSHKMPLSFNWIINWILRSPFGFFPWSFPSLVSRSQVGFMKFQRILEAQHHLNPWIFSQYSLTPPGASTEGIFLYFPREKRWTSVEEAEKQRELDARNQYYFKQLCIRWFAS